MRLKINKLICITSAVILIAIKSGCSNMDLAKGNITEASSSGNQLANFDSVQIEDLIKQLGNNDWSKRESAQIELIRRGAAIKPIIQKGLDTTTDFEIRHRLNEILKAFSWGNPVNGLQALISVDKTEYEEGEDVFIDFSVQNASQKDIQIFERYSCSRYEFHVLIFSNDEKEVKFQDVAYECDKNIPCHGNLNPGKIYTVRFNPVEKNRPKYLSPGLALQPGIYKVKGVYERQGDTSCWQGRITSNTIIIKISKKK